MFKELGWDVDNTRGYAEAYKDVVHEDAIKVGGFTKAPDYSFRVGGTRKFFLEAKKPSVDIKQDIHPAYQLRRYAWSAKLPLSILTDFEELAVYDCRIRPAKGDKASKARTIYMKYTDYLEKWDDIASVFHREQVLKGSFDKYAESSKKKKGTAEVDDAFLSEIEDWRVQLARNIALRNKGLSERNVNSAVQRTIDRILFLRISEDRGIERYARLMALQSGDRVYPRMCQHFREADERYNSGLFHFQKEKGRQDADTWTLNLNIDDKCLKDIIKRLYYPESPYEFSVLPADILGNVYERFLGSVITLTTGHHAKVEQKPEVRKAGGVYYTPTYIVDYIVKNTVGKLLEGKTPQEAAAQTPTGKRAKGKRPIAILDPACGSGSFLIGAYQFLLDWYLEQYAEDTEKWSKGKNPVLYQHHKLGWRLTTTERKRILLDHIHGVDIDTQAVEVTKLSLLLKVLEEESQDTIGQLEIRHQRVLPDLSNNVKCGNSLIGPDFYTGKQMDFDEEEMYRINAFDWSTEFKDVMSSDGFDAVIGNPPYGYHQIHGRQEKDYFKKKYHAALGSFEHYFLFYERSLSLLRENGKHGFIVPVTWLTIPSARSLRKHILENFALEYIIWLPEFVFRQAKVNTLVSIISKNASEHFQAEIHDSLGFVEPPKHIRHFEQNAIDNDTYSIDIFLEPEAVPIINKLQSLSVQLSCLAKPCSGYNPYEVGKGMAPDGGKHTKKTVREKPYHSNEKLGNSWKREIRGRDLRRYSLEPQEDRWIKYGSWLAAERDPENFLGRRLLVQEVVGGKERRIVATFVDFELYYSRDVIPVLTDQSFPNPLFLLAIVNSCLITWYHQRLNPKAQKGLFPKVLVSDLRKLPIIDLDIENRRDIERHDKMVSLVKQMLALNKKLSAAKSGDEKTLLQRQIQTTDHQIDTLVYELYDLTDEEIAIVEGGVRHDGRGKMAT